VAVASQATGVARVEHIMGMPIVVDVRDVDDAAALEPLFDGSATSTGRSAPTSQTARSVV
jgi:hypothetical protein